MHPDPSLKIAESPTLLPHCQEVYVKVPSWCIVSIGAVLLASASFAGTNAGGAAYLSWDRVDTLATIQVPETDPFPLYVHIDGAPDIRELAITLRWMPDTTMSCSYRFVSSTLDDSCGAATDAPPGGAFAGDSSYTGSIEFAALDSARGCVTYSFSKAPCDTAPPGKFFISSILTMDSDGAVDTLAVVGAARIMGQSGVGPPDLSQRPVRPVPPAQLSMMAWPNPTRATVNLDLTLPLSGEIRVGIYDLAGRCLRDLTHEWVRAGRHTYVWDLTSAQGGAVRSGIYFARVAAPGGRRLVRVVVVK